MPAKSAIAQVDNDVATVDPTQLLARLNAAGDLRIIADAAVEGDEVGVHALLRA